MIQLDNKKKIIILIIAVTVIILLIFILASKKVSKNNQLIISTPVSVGTKVPPARIMTEEEKTNKVFIDPSQNVEVTNDQDGLYIYRLKK